MPRLKMTLERLRTSLNRKTETAYAERDEAAPSSTEESFAAGEAYAYGDAADEVRDEQLDEDRATRA